MTGKVEKNMNNQAELKKSFIRVSSALKKKPALGQDTYVSTTRVNDQLCCEIQEGKWRFRADMPKEAGGQESASTPGALGRAALGSCLAIGYMLWASRLDVPVISLEVEVHADSDDAGLFGAADIEPGYSEIRYRVNIESPAPEADVVKLLNEGDKHSPWLDVFTRPVVCKREVIIREPTVIPGSREGYSSE
ncbi:MAG: OsmC family protein [Gammaproteobacteria bacterium]|nr:OsmC family protein [Gammaproteobacteria bacterium]